MLTCIYLHGLGDGPHTADVFLRLLENIPMHVVAPDIRTVLAGVATETLTIEDVAQSLDRQLAISDKLQLLIIGHSLGGLIAIALAERLQRCVGLVLLEGSLREGDARVVGQYQCSSGMSDGWKRLVDELSVIAADSSISRDYLEEVKVTPPALFCRLTAQLVDRYQEFAERYRDLDIPRIYIEGAESESREGDHGSVCRDPALGCSAVVVPSAKHWVHVDQPEKVLEVLKKWMNTL